MRVGLTGGIGSGKSTVSAALVQLGAFLVDTDAIAKSLTLPSGKAMPLIEASFSSVVIAANGGLDRTRMREIVFQDPSARLRLERILHPMIGVACEELAGAAGKRPVIFDVPLLVESGRWRSLVDKVLVVDARESTQVQRVIARSGWSADAVQAVIASQAPRAQRRAAADALIFNDQLSLEALAAEVQSLWSQWTMPTTR